MNGIDRQYPDYVDYSNQRIPAQGVKLNLDLDFLVCCDCTDNCRVKIYKTRVKSQFYGEDNIIYLTFMGTQSLL